MERIEQLLRALFVLNFIVFFVLAVEDKPPKLVLSGISVSVVGLISLLILPPFLYRRRFYRLVEKYASSRMLSYSADERISQDVRFAMLVVLGFAILVAGAVLEIVTHHLVFLAISFFVVVSYGFVWGMRRLSGKRKALENAAEHLHLAYDFDKAHQIPRLLGVFRGRGVFVCLEVVRTISGASGGGYLSRSGGFIGNSSSSLRTSEITSISARANVPSTTYLLLQDGKRKSKPPELVSYLMGRLDLAERVKVVAPLARIELRPPFLSLRWRGAVTNLVELRFLLDLVCDIAEAVEAFAPGG
ncbi:MAG: hypothetical protein J7M34_00195 [Anaerolineae bacterium]|nr:hypothetical protein [Anaerolineae bacterium]